jgi:predicted MFS family arabinose efflux permease
MTKLFPRGYDRRIWILFYSRLIDGVGFSIIGPFLALFMYQSLGVSMAMVGLVLLMAGLAGAGGSLVGGLMADRYGRWGVMTWSMLLRCVTFLVLAFQVSLWPDVLGVSITLTLSYFFGGVFDPANNAMVADLVEPAKRLEAYGLMRVAWNLGFAIGPMIGGILVAWSFLWTFVISAVISLLAALVVAFFLSETYVPKPREKGPGLLKSIGSVNKLFLVLCFVLMPMFIMSGQFGVIYVVFANERVGIDTVTIGAIFALNGLMVVLLQFPIARWLEGRNYYLAMAGGSLLYAVGYMAIAPISNGLGLALTMVIITFGEMVVVPVATNLTVEMSPEDQRGKYLGIFGLFASVGWFASSLVGGFMYDNISSGWVLWGFVAFLGVVTAVGLLPLAWRAKKVSAKN